MSLLPLIPIAALSAKVSHRKRRWQTLLCRMAFAGLVVALTRPGSAVQLTVGAQEGVEVMVTLGVSPRILAEDVMPNRQSRPQTDVQAHHKSSVDSWPSTSRVPLPASEHSRQSPDIER